MKLSSLKKVLSKYLKQIVEPKIKRRFGFDCNLSVYAVTEEKTKWNEGYPQSVLTVYVDTDPIQGENYYKDPNDDTDWEDYIKLQVSDSLDKLISLNTMENPFRAVKVNKRPLYKIEENKLPFKEKKYDNLRIRTFSEKVDDGELTWHRDREDRLVTSLHETDWLVQIDNELPKSLSESQEVFIPKGVYHRLIKGTGELKVKVKLLN